MKVIIIIVYYRYKPVPVDHTSDSSFFLLSQGIQRRIKMSLLYEAGSELYWSKVNEIAIGSIHDFPLHENAKLLQLHLLHILFYAK